MISYAEAEARITHAINEIDWEALLDAAISVFSRYGVALAGELFPRSWCVSTVKKCSERGRLWCGSAADSYITLYVPGILRNSRHAPLELVALHVYCHELIHFVGKRHISEDAFVNGFHFYVKLEHPLLSGPVYASSYLYMNEATVEFLGRALLGEYLKRRIPSNVRQTQIDTYLEAVKNNRRGFYKIPVRFLDMLVQRASETSGKTQESVWQWLVSAYAYGTHLYTDETWLSLAKAPGMPVVLASGLGDADETWLELVMDCYLAPKVESRDLADFVSDLYQKWI